MPPTLDENILDAQEVKWQRIVYPVVAAVLVLLVGLGIYYYQQSQRDAREVAARLAVVQAKTPEALVKAADQYPDTAEADLALLSAANLSFQKADYAAATANYQRVADSSSADPVLRDSARVGLASTLEADNKIDQAIQTYLEVAHRGKNSPYAPFAYISAAQLYEKKHDTANERKILGEAAGMGGDSEFVKEADLRLKSLNASAQTPVPLPVQTPAKPTAPTPTPAPAK